MNNMNMNKENAFYEELGRLVAKYVIGNNSDFFQKITFMFNPHDISATKVKQPTREEKLKEFGKSGFGVKNASCIVASDRANELIDKILSKYPEIKVKEKGGCKNGQFNCKTAASVIIDRYDTDGKIVDEAIGMLINAEYHKSEKGITKDKLELVTRILALHQRRGKTAAKESLMRILKSQTMASLLVLAKETKLYTQRSDIDMRVLYVEAEIAKNGGIRNQFKK